MRIEREWRGQGTRDSVLGIARRLVDEWMRG